jgi:hypothetical protein
MTLGCGYGNQRSGLRFVGVYGAGKERTGTCICPSRALRMSLYICHAASWTSTFDTMDPLQVPLISHDNVLTALAKVNVHEPGSSLEDTEQRRWYFGKKSRGDASWYPWASA